LLLATAATFAAAAADVERYFASTANDKPRGDAGLALKNSRLRFAADVALRARDDTTEILPKLTSKLALAPRVDLETRVDLAEWNSSSRLLDAKFATKLHVQAPAPFLDELEGRVWRLPDGQTGRLLRLGFYQRMGERHGSDALSLRTKATVETGSVVGRRLAVETELKGFDPAPGKGRSALRLKVVRSFGAAPEAARTLAYDRAWSLPGASQIAVNVGVQESTAPLDTAGPTPSFGVSWRAAL
jgi:hypothetical protein